MALQSRKLVRLTFGVMYGICMILILPKLIKRARISSILIIGVYNCLKVTIIIVLYALIPISISSHDDVR
jgi:hypothetical protein